MGVLGNDWIRIGFLMPAGDVGVVGALRYPDKTIQHAGLSPNLEMFGHTLIFSCRSFGYRNRLAIALNVAAVTGACLVVKELWDELGGMSRGTADAYKRGLLSKGKRGLGMRVMWTTFLN